MRNSIRSRNPRASLTRLLFISLLPTFEGSLDAGLTGTDMVVPAVARAPGQAGSNFFSTVWVSNVGDAPATLEFRFHETDRSNTNPLKFTDSIGLGETKRYDNIVERYFGKTNSSGAIRVLASNEIYVSSRTYSLAPAGNLRDSNGLFFSAVPTAQAIGMNQTTIIQGITQGASEDFRYNAGLVEVSGQAVTVLVSIRENGTRALGSKSYSLPPFGRIQFPVTEVAPTIATTNAVAEARVTAGAGRVLFFGTQLTNGSNDSAGFEMSLRSATGSPLSSSIGDRCSTAPSGQRLVVLGDAYVLVEVDVVLENSSDRYALRYPVRIAGNTNIIVDTPINLRAACYRSPVFACTYPCQTGSICGYQALFCQSSGFRCQYQAFPGQAAKWTCHAEATERVTILVDDAHDPIFLGFSHSEAYSYSVPDATAISYNFTAASYPRPTVDPASFLPPIDSLLNFISLRRR